MVKQSIVFATKANWHWKKISGNKKVKFRENLTQPGRFLTNFIYIPVKNTQLPASKRENRVRGRPSKHFDRKKHRAQR